MNVAAGVAVLGDLPSGVEQDYFLTRACLIDARGGLEIGQNVTFGFGVKVLTRSHSVAGGVVGEVVSRPVKIGANAWIGSYALLYNCIIGDNSVVATGAVVRSAEVGPGVMVAGNPAVVIARLIEGQWKYYAPKWHILR